MDFISQLENKIMLLDGGMGTMIQKYGFTETDYRGREFLSHTCSLSGFNDILSITKPTAIEKIHKSYLEAGADIITTNTFNSNAISIKDYGFESFPGLIKRLNIESARIAARAIKHLENKISSSNHYIAGSIGPTNRSASMSPDIQNPFERNITYDELFSAYEEQICGLIEGGVDILLFETFYDTLNLKAGLDAANHVMSEMKRSLPIMISATICDKAGHILTGQDLPAFVTSICNYDNVVSIGLNCGFGPDEMRQYLNIISKYSPHYISCHPNAGLPDDMGCYSLHPEKFKYSIEEILKDGKVNIIGGCCGTTPEHIFAVKSIINNYTPYCKKSLNSVLRLSGIEAIEEKGNDDFLIVGERCNVAGSRRFLKLIKEKKIEEASEIAKKEILDGAIIIDINMDDPMLNPIEESVNFIRYISSEPQIAKAPLMIDSSKWEVIENCLKNIQGKGIVNSLSLKEGEDIFVKRAKRVRELGFALIVMAFDEKGQADSYNRKIEICDRAYKLLIDKCGFLQNDIIFDVNVMAIATGMPEHSRYAIDFIEAVKWIKTNLPGAKTSGGISNLSFSFRGKNKIREIMHSVFLYHAVKAGLDMAIVNPSTLIPYEEIPEDIRNLVEDVILTGNHEKENELFNLIIEEGKDNIQPENLNINSISIEKKLEMDMINGEVKDISSHLEIALKEFKDPLEIIDGPLMEGMKIVGDLFGEGKMFLPQVVKTARVMNAAVQFLKPYIEKERTYGNSKKIGKILIATVKGDVHDIGKNIVSTVLACNNFEVIDMGVMVPSEAIIDKIKEESPDFLCLSGLITPSLSEMSKVVAEMEKAGIKIPVMVGGAATSSLHTILRIAPLYSGEVIHMPDASQNPIVAKQLLDKEKRKLYLKSLKEKNNLILKEYYKNKNNLISFKEAIKNRHIYINHSISKPILNLGENKIINIKLNDVLKFINWKMFFNAWKIQDSFFNNFPFSLNTDEIEYWRNSLKDEHRIKGEEALELYQNAIQLIKEVENTHKFDGKAIIRFEEVSADERNIYIQNIIIPMLRQQKSDSSYLSITDFLNSEKDYIGLFALTAGKCWSELALKYNEKGNKYKSFILQTLGDRIAEASSEWLHSEVRHKYWGYSSNENLTETEILRGKYSGIRPAWGYPMLPDQKLILEIQSLLPFNEIGISLTENGAMSPSSSISGLYISNPHSHYFVIGEIGDDQLIDYSNRRGETKESINSILR